MATKRLFRVAVEGEIWVMAESPGEAQNETIHHLMEEADNLELYVYPILPKPHLVDEETKESLPYNTEPGDGRTVGVHLNVNASGCSPPVSVVPRESSGVSAPRESSKPEPAIIENLDVVRARTSERK